jgi:hypothetical protein
MSSLPSLCDDWKVLKSSECRGGSSIFSIFLKADGFDVCAVTVFFFSCSTNMGVLFLIRYVC